MNFTTKQGTAFQFALFVRRIDPTCPTWIRALAMLDCLCLDARQFTNVAAEDAPLQLLQRPKVPGQNGQLVDASYLRGDLRFTGSTSIHVSIPDDDPGQLAAFRAAVEQHLRTEQFVARVEYVRIDEQRRALENARRGDEAELLLPELRRLSAVSHAQIRNVEQELIEQRGYRPTSGGPDYPPYEETVRMLVERAEVRVRRELLATSRRQAADAAYQGCDFGDNVDVEDASGWETDPRAEAMRRTVFVRFEGDAEDAPTTAVIFTVGFEPGTSTVSSVSALRQDNGAEVAAGLAEQTATAGSRATERARTA